MRKIPTYDWDGERLRDYSEDAIRSLIAQRKVAAMIGRNDRILFATFLRPITRTRAASRPKYKVIQVEMRLPGTEVIAALFAIDETEAQEYLDSYQRAIFSQVLLNASRCSLPAQKDKVVKIQPDVDVSPTFQDLVFRTWFCARGQHPKTEIRTIPGSDSELRLPLTEPEKDILASLAA